jgi:hypothetical protein
MSTVVELASRTVGISQCSSVRCPPSTPPLHCIAPVQRQTTQLLELCDARVLDPQCRCSRYILCTTQGDLAIR